LASPPRDVTTPAGSDPASAARTAAARSGLLAAFAGVSCFLALIQIFCVFFSLIGIALNQPLAIIILVLILIISYLFATRFREPGTEQALTPSSKRANPLLTGVLKILGIGFLLWAGWVWLQLWILASLRPPYDWDGLYYHIPAIHEWVLAGRVLWIGNMMDIPFVSYPMGVEVCTFFMHHIFQTTRLVNACNLWYWPLAFLAVVVIASRLGARGIWKWLAGALVIGAPVFISQSVSCYIDIGFASAVMAAIAASCIFVFHKELSLWYKAILFAANVGLAAGSKGTGLPFAAVFFAAVIIGLLCVYGFKYWKTWRRQILIGVLIVLAIGGYWYVRNTIKTGNPIYPLQLKFGVNVLIEGYDHVLFNEANMPPWLEKYPPPTRMFISWLQLDAPISSYAPIGGMGYIWIAGALPAFFFLWIQILRKRRSTVCPIGEFAFLTALVLTLLIVQPAAWWARFTLWLHALGLPCFAVVLHQVVSRWPMAKRSFIPVLIGFLVICAAIWESQKTLQIEWKTGRIPQAQGTFGKFLSSQEYMFPGMAETSGFKAFLRARKIARSPWGRMGTLLGGVLAMPLGQREIRVLPRELEFEDISSLREAGVQWVIWDVLGAGEVPEILTREAQEEHAYHPAHDVNCHIIRL